MTLSVGDGNTGTGGAVAITAGASSDALGGGVTITAGATTKASTNGGDVTLTPGSGTALSGNVLITLPNGNTVAKFSSGGLMLGGTAAPLATITKVFDARVEMDAVSSPVAADGEMTASATVAGVSAGDMALCTPPTDTAAASLVWSAYTTANTVTIRISNVSSGDYSETAIWNCLVFVKA
jgi:hypothetical protein